MAPSGNVPRVVGALLAALLALAGGSAARAAPRLDEAVRVVIGDLDFSSARDIELFRRRVDQAARALCGRQGQLDFLETHACYRGVRDQFVRKLSDGQRRQLFAISSQPER
jgi:UrcA family protein